MTEGYVLVATGPRKYFEMAATAARSFRFFDAGRRICLACDDPAGIAPAERALYDDVAVLPRQDRLRGTEFHLYLNEVSPYGRSIYVDADCLMANARIHAIWEELKAYTVAFPGKKLTEGFWRVDIPQLMAAFGADWIVQCNGGVFYFDRSAEAGRFFRTAQDYFENHREAVTVKHGTGGGFANEPIWGLTMGKLKTEVFSLKRHMNVSTLRTERWEIDSTPSIKLWKDGRVWTPVFCHFLGLGGQKCPNELYRAFAGLVSGAEVG